MESFTVNSRHLRLPNLKSFERPAVKVPAITVSAKGFQAGGWLDWSVTRPLLSSLLSIIFGDSWVLTFDDVYVRALLIQSTSHYDLVKTAEASSTSLLKPKVPLSASWQAGEWGENLNVSGTANCNTLCIGDVLTSSNSKLRLQVSSARRPCSRVDNFEGKTWNEHGLRAHCARNGQAGIFVRVLEPGVIHDGDVFHVVERRHPKYTVSRVCELLYGMDGACDKPSGYTLPGLGTKHSKTNVNALGGGKMLVQQMFQGTYEELQELAGMSEMADFEWREEFQAMLAAWDGTEGSEMARRRRSRGIRLVVMVGVVVLMVAYLFA